MQTSWNDIMTARLRELWADSSITADDIAEQLGVTKNAVVGKAHRIGLPQRRPSVADDAGEDLEPDLDDNSTGCRWLMCQQNAHEPENGRSRSRRFCGKPVVSVLRALHKGPQRVSYCAEHFAKAYKNARQLILLDDAAVARYGQDPDFVREMERRHRQVSRDRSA